MFQQATVRHISSSPDPWLILQLLSYSLGGCALFCLHSSEIPQKFPNNLCQSYLNHDWQTIALSSIINDLPHLAPEVSPAEEIAAGGIDLPTIAPWLSVLASLRSNWNTAISRAMIFSLAMVCAVLPFMLGMEFLTQRKSQAHRKKRPKIRPFLDSDKNFNLCYAKTSKEILVGSTGSQNQIEAP